MYSHFVSHSRAEVLEVLALGDRLISSVQELNHGYEKWRLI
jgi:hypothetical protein